MASNTHFQTMAKVYEKSVGATSSRLAAKALSFLPLSSYSSSSKFLDSASGPGIATKLLLTETPENQAIRGLPIVPNPHVVAIDLAPQMVAQFEANKAAHGWATAEGRVQDSQDLSQFGDGEFDAVVMNLGVFTLQDPAAGAREMLRVLKPGGHAVVTSWKKRRVQTLFQGVINAVRGAGAGDGFMDQDSKWESEEYLAELMREGGFSAERVSCSAFRPDWTSESLDGLLEALSAPLWKDKVCAGWSASETERYEAEVMRQLTEEEKSSARLEMQAIICVAAKG